MQHMNNSIKTPIRPEPIWYDIYDSILTSRTRYPIFTTRGKRRLIVGTHADRRFSAFTLINQKNYKCSKNNVILTRQGSKSTKKEVYCSCGIRYITYTRRGITIDEVLGAFNEFHDRFFL